MKLRRNLTALVLGLSTIAAFAQSGNTETRQIKEEGKTVFNPHWFMQVQAGASHTVGEAKFGDLISPAAALNVGYQFTPLWGLRAGLSGWEAKGAWVSPETIYKYNYLQGNVDATLDLSNLFCGYNPTRFFNAYLFGGIGVNGAFNNDEAVAIIGISVARQQSKCRRPFRLGHELTHQRPCILQHRSECQHDV